MSEGSCVFVLKEEERRCLKAKQPLLEAAVDAVCCVVWKGISKWETTRSVTCSIHVMTNETVLSSIRRLLTMN